MLAAKSTFKDAEKTKKYITEKKLFNYTYEIKKDKKHIYFPIIKKDSSLEVIDLDLKKRDVQETDIRKILKNHLTSEELSKLKTAMDIIGNISIIEVDDSLSSKEKIIAEIILKSNPHIKTVLKKEGIHEGELRTQKYKFLSGINTKETTHIENGIRLKLNVEKVYYSPRSSFERKRIFDQVKPDEDILVMFSGCGPFPLTISKNSSAKHIVGVELNKLGHKYAEENKTLNKIKNIDFFCGDVRKIVPSLNQTFDRIIMPLPKTADEFLDLALQVSKKGTIIHLYDFLQEPEFKTIPEQILEKATKNTNFKFKILRTVKCGHHAPFTYRVCSDIKII